MIRDSRVSEGEWRVLADGTTVAMKITMGGSPTVSLTVKHCGGAMWLTAYQYKIILFFINVN